MLTQWEDGKRRTISIQIVIVNAKARNTALLKALIMLVIIIAGGGCNRKGGIPLKLPMLTLAAPLTKLAMMSALAATLFALLCG